jgi:hypothetical protein
MGRAGSDESGGESEAAGRQCERCRVDAVRMLDAEEFHATWSAVRPGVDYAGGSREAERAADVVRALYRRVARRAALDRVEAMTDLDGNPYLRVDLNAAGALDVVALMLDGLRFRGEITDGAA